MADLFGENVKASVDTDDPYAAQRAVRPWTDRERLQEISKQWIDAYVGGDLDGLMALIEKPDDEEEAKKWAGPYLKAESLKDSWGNDYIYVYPGEYNEDGYDLSSAGPDGEEGTDDDDVEIA